MDERLRGMERRAKQGDHEARAALARADRRATGQETCRARLGSDSHKAIFYAGGYDGGAVTLWLHRLPNGGVCMDDRNCCPNVDVAREPLDPLLLEWLIATDALRCVSCGGRCRGGDCGADHDTAEGEVDSHECCGCQRYVCGPCTGDGGLCPACLAVDA